MKKIVLIIYYLLYTAVAESQVYANYSLLNQQANKYTFSLSTYSNICCFPFNGFIAEKANDTVYLKGFYHIAMVCIGPCGRIDTIIYDKLYTGIKYINVSTNVIINNSSGSIDTIRMKSDSTFILNTTGVGNVPSTEDFLVYPNPSSDYISIAGADNFLNHRVVLSSAIGTEVYHGVLEEKIDVSSIPTGFYMLCVQDKQGTAILQRKVLIQH